MSGALEPFRGIVVERTHQISLHGDADAVFAMFGPIREADWAAGWDPELVSGDPEAPQPGCVFRTRDAVRGTTIWLLSRLEHAPRRIEYVKTTPSSDLTEITITVEAAGAACARAEVTYRLTGLSPTGNEYVTGFSELRYRELIDEWATAINHCLTTGGRLHTEL